ncbi:hypothetical protein S40288_00591 [Stachybotrys chartarum IBT 40288]|nr:hypothetical protein S40288_00591 [Stachybotrys chartarum IBT 40288]
MFKLRYSFVPRPFVRFVRRRLVLILVVLALCAVLLLSTFTGVLVSSPESSRLAPKSPVEVTPSASTSHPDRQQLPPPPRQENDTYAGSSWWADTRWRSTAFSSTLTLDDDRALLPPLPARPTIYCYYDTTNEKPHDELEAERALLLTWRRAWWASGFRPVIIGAAEATAHPLYSRVQTFNVGLGLKIDLLRWLAWDVAGGGLLAQYTLLPMVSAVDKLPPQLRKGDFSGVWRWNELKDGLLAANAVTLRATLQALVESADLKNAANIMSLLPDGPIQADPAPSSLAYYHTAVLEKRYAKVAKLIQQHRVDGLRSLNHLINAHLHVVWQNLFPLGIEVLKPLPGHTTAMVNGTLNFAKLLATCPETPLPSSCPPNLPQCVPCVPLSRGMSISTPRWYRNSTRVFTLGTVPHPWTLALVHNSRQDFDIGWIVRESPRDPWLAALTQSISGSGVSGAPRVIRLKQAVADIYTQRATLWFTAELGVPEDLDWYFGFAIPKKLSNYGMSQSPVPADRIVKIESKKKSSTEAEPSDDDVAKEVQLLARAKHMIAQVGHAAEVRLRASLEAWNMADTEAWKFIKAYQARRTMERVEWETSEARFMEGAGLERA